MAMSFKTSWFQSSALTKCPTVRALFLTATFIFVVGRSPTLTHAADICISIAVNPPASLTIVGQGFEIPPGGTAKNSTNDNATPMSFSASGDVCGGIPVP